MRSAGVPLAGTLLLALSAAMAAPAAAADYPVHPQGLMADDMPLRPAFSWSGAYFGALAGAARDTSTATEINTISDNTNPAYCAPPGTAGVPPGMYWCNVNGDLHHYTSTPSSSYNLIGDRWSVGSHSMTLGLLAGYNFQFGRWVYGVEAEVGHLALQARSGPSPASLNDTFLHVNATDYMAARLRLGYAFGRFLPFISAGLAMAHFNNYIDDPDIAIGITTQPTATHSGLALGMGAEYAITDHIILRGEWQRMYFAGQNSIGYVNVTCTPNSCPPQWKLDRLGMAGDGTAGWRIINTLDLMRVGASYKF